MGKQISDPSRPTATSIEPNDYFALDRGENGVTYRVPSALLQANQDFYFERTITPAEMLDAFDTPIDLVPAQGANTIIVPTSITGQMIYGTTPYATDGEIDVYCGGTRGVMGFPPDDGFLFGTVSRIVQLLQIATSNATDTQYVANSPLTLKTVGANPTAGDSTIVIRGFYKVIDIS